MLKRIVQIGILIFIFFLCLSNKEVFAISSFTDRITNSAPSATTSHEIIFRVGEDVPPSGRIRIEPEANSFIFESGFNYTDIDFATSSFFNGPYTERNVSEFQTIVSDRATVVASTSNDRIDIDLNTVTGVSEDTYVRFRLGGNAVYGDIGDRYVKNPTVAETKNVNIYTYDVGLSQVEYTNIPVATVEPVSMTNHVRRIMTDGTPVGWLSFGTTQTYMSLLTNYDGFCRYSTASNTPFDSMVDEFSYVGGDPSSYHTVLMGGFGAGGTYTYYIRCADKFGNHGDDESVCVYYVASTTVDQITGSSTTIYVEETTDCTDYIISFSVSAVAGGGGDDTGGGGDGDGGGEGGDDGDDNAGGSGSGGGGSGGGGSGGGSGGGRGNDRGRGTGDYLPYPPLPTDPGVVLEGYAYPGADVTVLKDGEEVGLMNSDLGGEFGGYIEEITQGTYTFGLWAKDSNERRSITYSTTFFAEEGTQTTVSDIIIPPTIEINKTSGTYLEILGQASIDGLVEAWFYPRKAGKLYDSEIIKTNAMVKSNGDWNMNIDIGGLEKGLYWVKAKVILDGIGESGFSQMLEYSLEVVAEPDGGCPGADLNKDGRVNITDFSILLYYWNTDNECADQNNSGNVDLIDFSIMMYYWTG